MESKTMYKKINIKGFSFWGITTDKTLEKGQEIEIPLKWGGTETRIIAKKVGENLYTLIPNNKSRAKKERKLAKYGAWSKANSEKSDERYNANDIYRDFLSLGEPIKIGHHSEKRHRGIYEKYDNNMRKSIELQEKSEAQAHKADNIQYQLNIIIYLDDFDAIPKVSAKLAKLEEERDRIKEHNKNNKDDKCPSYMLTNLGATIRKESKKLEALKSAYLDSEKESTETEGEFIKKEFKFSDYGAFFAFGDKQFNEQKKEGVKYVSMGAGLICPKSEASTIMKKFDDFNREQKALERKWRGKKKTTYKESGVECPCADFHKTRNTLKVTYENKDIITTSFNGTKEEAENYYLNKYFNLGAVEDNMQKCVKVEVI
jgi:hypothetical protein